MDQNLFREFLNQHGETKLKNKTDPDSVYWVSSSPQRPCSECGRNSSMIYKIVYLPRGRKLEKKCQLCKQYLGRLDQLD